MNNNKKESQFELFPGSSKYDEYAEREQNRRNILNSITLSLDKILMMGIVVIMIMVLSFSFGVEKGRRTPGVTLDAADRMRPAQSIAQEPERISADEDGFAEQVIGVDELHDEQRVEFPAQMAEDPDGLGGKYTVQVASFKTEKYAQKEALNLKDNGHAILVLPKGKHFIVSVGTFNEMNEAENFSGKLKNKYKDCLVRRL